MLLIERSRRSPSGHCPVSGKSAPSHGFRPIMAPVIRNDTHEVRIDRERGLVVKQFRSARRGEPVREWTALSLLDRLAPGLAPAPVSADLDSDFPVVTMS